MASLHRLETDIESLQAVISRAEPATRLALPEQQTLSRLRVRRNDLASPLFSCLPPELLLNILHMLVFMNHVAYPLGDAHILPRLMCVCTRMLSLVSEASILWSYIMLDCEPEWVRLCRMRAGDIPLSVAWTCGSAISHPRMEEFWNSVGEFPRLRTSQSTAQFNGIYARVDLACNTIEEIISSGRVRDLLVCGGIKSEVMDAIFNFSRLPLTSLTYRPRARTHVRISHNFLGGATTLLHTLKLSAVRLLTHELSFPSLAALDLCDVQIEGDPAGLFSLIRAAPRLEGLVLSGITPDDYMHEDAAPLGLPALQTVDCEVSLPWALALMRTLPVPTETYSIKVQPSYADKQLAMIAWRAEAYAEVGRITTMDWSATTVHLQARRRPEATHACLELTLEGNHTPPLAFRDRCTSISALLQVLSQAQAVHFLGWAVDRVASLGVNDQAGVFPALERAIVDRAPSFSSFLPWLRARAAAGRRIHALDVRAFYDADTYLRTIVAEGLAETILVNGRVPDLSVKVLSPTLTQITAETGLGVTPLDQPQRIPTRLW
jgi:hypothetical protein